MITSFKPLHDYILLRKLPDAEAMQRGLYVPTTVSRLARGEVVAVGPGRWHSGELQETSVDAGKRVLYRPDAAVEIEVNGEPHFLVAESNLLGTITEAD